MNGVAIAILLLTFVFLLVIKCPITFSMVISTSLAMLYLDIPVMTMVQQMCKPRPEPCTRLLAFL